MPVYNPYNEDYQLEAEYEAYCQAKYEAYLEAQEEDYIYNFLIMPQYFADLDAEQKQEIVEDPLAS